MTATTASPAAPVRWWLPLIEGILAILVGIWFFTQPVATSVNFVLAIGIYWFVVGVIDIAAAVLGSHDVGLEAVFRQSSASWPAGRYCRACWARTTRSGLHLSSDRR